jgi:PucR-like helix-turn-helix protein/diguanylate cyclase with GGDEF domain
VKVRRVQATPDARQTPRAWLAERLRDRRIEIEQAVLTRVFSISDPTDVPDSTYLGGLRAAVSAALEYSLAAIESAADRSPPAPPALLVQARLAARSGVGLDTVLRRYFAGYVLLGDFIIEEAERGDPLDGPELKRLLRSQATAFDRLIAAVTEEHACGSERRLDGPEQQRAERVQSLLDGELVDTSGFAYPFDDHHTGLVACGPGASDVLRQIAGARDCHLLLVNRDEQISWAWLGARGERSLADMQELLSTDLPPAVALGVGEPCKGLDGWRLTHRQATAVLPIAARSADRLARYADVALLASATQDDLLVTSLRRLYLEPLDSGREGGGIARQTLRAYFTADRNVSSAAASLGVKRHTVTNRLREIEGSIGFPIGHRLAELELALRLDELVAAQRTSQAAGAQVKAADS